MIGGRVIITAVTVTGIAIASILLLGYLGAMVESARQFIGPIVAVIAGLLLVFFGVRLPGNAQAKMIALVAGLAILGIGLIRLM